MLIAFITTVFQRNKRPTVITDNNKSNTNAINSELRGNNNKMKLIRSKNINNSANHRHNIENYTISKGRKPLYFIGCVPHCFECYSTGYCKVCQPGYFVTQNGQCQLECVGDECFPDQHCRPGTYLDINGRCEPCDVSCGECERRPNFCTSCNSMTEVLWIGNCLDKCPENTYEEMGNCRPCNIMCKTCIGSEDYCTSCQNGM